MRNKTMIVFIILGLLASGSLVRPYDSLAMGLSPRNEAIKTERTKILKVIDSLRNSKLKVIFDGIEYDMNFALLKAKMFVFKNYKNEKATTWISQNLYRSPGGEIIYLKYPDGDMRPIRDVILARLKMITIA